MSLCKWILIAIFFSITMHAHAEDCLNGLPDSFRSAVEKDNWKIVQRAALSESDQAVWKNDHPGDCPGVIVGNFSPKAKSSFIVALIQRDLHDTLLEKVVLMTEKKHQPEIEDAITTMAVATPYVVSKVPKGRYLGIDGGKASITRESFIYQKLVGPASQYYYHGSQLKSLVLSR